MSKNKQRRQQIKHYKLGMSHARLGFTEPASPRNESYMRGWREGLYIVERAEAKRRKRNPFWAFIIAFVLTLLICMVAG